MIQHIVGTAVALGLKHLRGPSKVRLKWPNDIYYGSSLKLGGILVSSSICGDSLSVNIGLGLNLNNDRPLPSLNSLLAAERAHNPIRREEFIAETLNALEMLLERVEAGDWDWVLGDYYAHWIHDDQNVKLLNMESKSFECGVIKGLDPFGFLVVETERKGRVTVHPDGNSFDMVKGLILPK
eukprot:TRINITY_DN9021_c0_g1_i1.p1 TRINITY_DN9021_c0_g1~~TRINITY_DN9021_c0_g1_i1.p1  ORF type:complete len:182 (+),score=53.36 TRINITY_DN9021_c0_g1_i1:191-736(+)